MTEPLSPQAAERSLPVAPAPHPGLVRAGVLGFWRLMTWASSVGCRAIGLAPFLFLMVMVYAAIGVYGRTTDLEEYYVAGRRIPPMYNGMAAAADWMSTASFISLAGRCTCKVFPVAWAARRFGLFAGLDGRFCLVAMLIAPHLRAMQMPPCRIFSRCVSVGAGRASLQPWLQCCALSPMWWRKSPVWV